MKAKKQTNFRIIIKNHDNQLIHIFEGDKKQMKRFLSKQVDILSKLMANGKGINISITKIGV